MQISYNWLKQFIDIHSSPEEISAILTGIGLEVEGIEEFESVKGGFKGLVLGKILTCEKHPNADKLSKTTVDVGNNTILPIVCGAPNVAAGQTVVVALVGATVYPTEGDPFTIQKAKIRGEISEGMICAEDEIGLGNSHAGIMVLETSLTVGTPAATYFKTENDHLFVIGLTPNRADAASHLGVARDLYAAITEQFKTGMDFRKPDVSSFKIDNTSSPVAVKVEDASACPRYAGLTISGIEIKASPEWLQNRLKAIGLNPINNIVDVTNYVLHELGQPLHAFDYDKIKGKQIVVKQVAEGTPFVTLDGKERKLYHTDLLICDEKGPMCIAGVFGGQDSGVQASTESIFLESAYFAPDSIRKTSQLHGLKTDASFRFERGIDPNITIYALKRAALLIKEVAGGTISSEITDIYPEPVRNFNFAVSFAHIDRLIGLKLTADTIFSILESLEIGVSNETKEGFMVSVPPYRVDVKREADIAEEIVRIYGFDKIPVSDHLDSEYLASFPTITREKIDNTVANLLAYKGFNEIMANSLTRPEYAESLGLTGSNVSIINKLSDELGVMRQSLLFSGLEAIAYNINRRQKDLKFFELGKTYHKIGEGTKVTDYKENTCLSVFISGAQQAESWKEKQILSGFHDMAAVVHHVLFGLNITGTQQAKSTNEVFSQALSVEKNTKTLVTYGLLKSKYCKLQDIKQPVLYAEFNMDYIYKIVSNKLVYNEIPKVPEVRRDLSLVIDKKVTFEEIQKLALSVEKKLLKDINVFDAYEGDKIDKDKKAYAVSFLLQDEQQTLTDKQIETTMSRLMEVFESKLGAVIRK